MSSKTSVTPTLVEAIAAAIVAVRTLPVETDVNEVRRVLNKALRSVNDNKDIFKVKRRAEKHDPDAPKRARTGFMFFSNERRDAVVKEHPELRSRVKEVARLLGAEWKSLSQERLAHYKSLADADRKRYETEDAEYRKQRGLPARKPSAPKKVAAPAVVETVAPVAPAAAGKKAAAAKASAPAVEAAKAPAAPVKAAKKSAAK